MVPAKSAGRLAFLPHKMPSRQIIEHSWSSWPPQVHHGVCQLSGCRLAIKGRQPGVSEMTYIFKACCVGDTACPHAGHGPPLLLPCTEHAVYFRTTITSRPRSRFSLHINRVYINRAMLLVL